MMRSPRSWPLRLAAAAVLALPATAFAGPEDDANAVVDRWAAAYTANDVDALVGLYTSNAILLGTTSPIASRGAAAIRTYFQDMPGSGRRNTLGERFTVLLSENAVLVTGFYDFARREQNYEPRPSRFTMVVVKRDGRWLIAHHHSSPKAAARQ